MSEEVQKTLHDFLKATYLKDARNIMIQISGMEWLVDAMIDEYGIPKAFELFGKALAETDKEKEE